MKQLEPLGGLFDVTGDYWMHFPLSVVSGNGRTEVEKKCLDGWWSHLLDDWMTSFQRSHLKFQCRDVAGMQEL